MGAAIVTSEQRGASAYWAPVAAAIGLLCVLNGLWSLPGLELYNKFPHAIAVWLPTSLLCVALLWRAGRGGVLTRNDAALGLQGWAPWKRLLALSATVFLGLGGYFTLQPPSGAGSTDAPNIDAASDSATAQSPTTQAATAEVANDAMMKMKPTFGDYCFWWVYLLSATIAELLVFASIVFCLPERYFRTRGWGVFPAGAAAAVFAAVTFGLYHYTHEPRWWPYVFLPLMPMMLINLTVFAVTRNFWLTMVLHNTFASVSFTQEQWKESLSESPSVYLMVETYLKPGDHALTYIVAAFVIPFLALHVVEARGFKPDKAVS